MLLLIDNYDSFTYNLYQFLAELGAEVEVRRNDQIDVEGIEALAPSQIVISPGPKTPDEAGISLEVIEKLGGKIPILGVCLGHQCIGQHFGGRVVRAPGADARQDVGGLPPGLGVMRNLPNPFTVARYHSLIVDRASVPDCLEITAETADGIVMGLRHRTLPIEGVQFHPESILTPQGKQLLGSFLGGAGRGA